MLTCVTEIRAEEVDMIEGKGKEFRGSITIVATRGPTPEWGIILVVAMFIPCATKRCCKLG